MMKKLHFLFVFAFTASLFSCGRNPVFIDMGKTSILGVEASTMTIRMEYVLYNPNHFHTTLKGTAFTIYHKDTVVGTGDLSHEIALVPKDTVIIPLKIKIDLNRFARFYPALLTSDSTAFDVKGACDLRVVTRSLTVPINERIYLNTKKIVQQEIEKALTDHENFRIKDFRLNALPTLAESSFSMKIQLNNILPFDYLINKMELSFTNPSNQAALARWELTKPYEQKAGESTTVPIQMRVTNLDLLWGIDPSWLIKTGAELEVRGNVDVDINGHTFSIPIDQKATVAIKTLIGILK